jgi:oligopeptide transport system ATP-binding protein
MSEPLLQVRGLQVRFARRGWLAPPFVAIDDVDLSVAVGESVGLVGESGSGKSTLARALARLIPSAAGQVLLRGENLLQLSAARMRQQRQHLQLVFQDPLASLNPRMTVADALSEPLQVFQPQWSQSQRRAAVQAMLLSVGLSPQDAQRYPRQFSGGQCQRIGIARAMMLGPELLICDEPVSALDVSIQGQILNLLMQLRRERGTALIFISHNLEVVRHVTQRVYVLFRGSVVEHAPSATLFAHPQHPYTRELLAAVPRLTAAAPLTTAPVRVGVVPAVNAGGANAGGCAYRDRCPHAIAVCAAMRPRLTAVGTAHEAACLRLAEI